MALFKKKVDPVTERARALNAEIAALEAQIQKLSQRPEALPPPVPPTPKLRSTALPHAAQVSHGQTEPIFEEVIQGPLAPAPEPGSTPQHYNDLGVRKYDLAAAWRRTRNHLQSKPVANPKLVNYLAAGSIHGLRPLRYEKRVARRRFVGLAVVLFLILLGILWLFLKQHQ